VRAPRPSAKRPGSLRNRLDECDIADLITAYREGATAAPLAAAHDLSLKSVQRLLRISPCPTDITHSTSYESYAGSDVSVAAHVGRSPRTAAEEDVVPGDSSLHERALDGTTLAVAGGRVGVQPVRAGATRPRRGTAGSEGAACSAAAVTVAPIRSTSLLPHIAHLGTPEIPLTDPPGDRLAEIDNCRMKNRRVATRSHFCATSTSMAWPPDHMSRPPLTEITLPVM
jgi:hypothetical protein